MLRKLKAALLGGALMLGSLSGVQAGETNTWRQVGDWLVRIDTTMGNGCYAVATYTTGTIVRVGIDSRDRQGYIAVYGDGLVAGRSYDVRFEFDGSGYTTKAAAYADGDRVFLANWNMSVDAMVDFAQRNTLKVIVDGRTLAFVNLRGTYAALSEMFECQKAQNNSQGSTPAPQARVQPPVSNDGPWQVPVQRQGSGITLSVSLNDGAAVQFMLDTGATAIGISQDLADRMGLKVIRRIKVQYANGTSGMESIVMLDKVALNGVFLRNVEATVGPVGSPLLLGKNFLDRFSSYSIDNRQSLLILNK